MVFHPLRAAMLQGLTALLDQRMPEGHLRDRIRVAREQVDVMEREPHAMLRGLHFVPATGLGLLDPGLLRDSVFSRPDRSPAVTCQVGAGFSIPLSCASLASVRSAVSVSSDPAVCYGLGRNGVTAATIGCHLVPETLARVVGLLRL